MRRISARLLVGCFGLFALVLSATSNVHADYTTETIDGVEWTTNKNFSNVGSPKAKKGGELRTIIQRWVPTLRRLGPGSNLTTITDIHGLTHETLLVLHPETSKFMPKVATHWRVSDDKKTFWFKLDPRAKFADGSQITSDDIVASYELLVNPDIQDPSISKLYSDYYEKPVAVDARTVMIKAKVLSWRAMHYIALSMQIYPAKQGRMPGDVYLKEFNWKQLMGSGPYHIANPTQDVKDSHSILLTRREDYWRKDLPGARYLYNFDRLRFVVVTDQGLAFQKLKAGELDYMQVYRSQRWVEETGDDSFKQGHLQKRKVFNQIPNSFSGYMFNMRKWPFDDKQVRLAFAYAFNREKLFSEFFFNEYEYIDSYYPGQQWGNPKNRKIRYNPRRASRYLEQAGYTKRNDDGVLVHEKTGRALEFELEYDQKSAERIHRPVVEDLKKIGIKMTLKLVDPNALTERVGERKFLLVFRSWRGILFPNPLTAWHSDLAQKEHNNNLTGFADPEVDALMTEYDKTFEHDKQVEILRKVDSIIFKSYCTALGWYAPFTRLAYWDRYGMPDTVLSRTGDQSDTWSFWWYDAEKDAALKAAIASKSALPVGEMIVDPWNVKGKTEDAKSVDANGQKK